MVENCLHTDYENSIEIYNIPNIPVFTDNDISDELQSMNVKNAPDKKLYILTGCVIIGITIIIYFYPTI